MKKPIAISLGLFLFLFGLAFAKAMKLESSQQADSNTGKHSRLPASATFRAE